MSDVLPSTIAQKSTGLVVLEFDQDKGVKDKKKLRNGISAVVHTGDTLWLANDEAPSLERLVAQPPGADGTQRYGGHTRFALEKYLNLNVDQEGVEANKIAECDLEGLDCRDGYLWLIGSHSLKRTKPDADESVQTNFVRLAMVTSDADRFLLARIPLLSENGTYILQSADQIPVMVSCGAALRATI